MIKTLRRLIQRREDRLLVRERERAAAVPQLEDVDEYTTGMSAVDDRCIVTHCYRLMDEQLVGEECQLLDLSRSGVKLYIPSKIEIGEAIGIRIQSDDLGIDVGEAASVCWTGYRGDGNLIIGCALAQDLDERVYEAIVDSGILERRREPRKKISMQARVIREDAKQLVDVRLDDYSQGGFGMFAQEPINRGEDLRLQLDCPNGMFVEIRAEARWRASTKFGYSIGCRFQTENGFQIFENAVNLSQQDEEEKSPPQDAPPSRSLTQWFAAVVGMGRRD